MPDVHRGVKYIILALFFAPIYLILTKLFPVKDFKNNDLSEKDLKKYRNIFFAYAFINVALVVLLLSDKIVFRK